jgi:hypothetical protein
MMQSPKVYVGTDDNVVVWRLRKNKQLEYLAVVIETQLLYVRTDGASVLLTVPAHECPLRVVTEVLVEEDPAQALKDRIANGSFDDITDLVTDPFLAQWDKLVQPQGEAQLFAPPPSTFTILEF